MILGALLDLGAPARAVREALKSLDIEPVVLKVSKVKRGALAGRHVSFRGAGRTESERKFASIRALLERSTLPEQVRARSLDVFTRLAEAEARVHGISADDVHFH